MAKSREWRLLQKEVEKLRKQFLPDPFDRLGIYPHRARVQAHTRAFLILSHAELETYFEDGARSIALAAEQVWISSGRVSLPLAYLAIFTAKELRSPNALSGAAPVDSPQMMAAEVTEIFRRFNKFIGKNHGVKEHNVASLFSPLGVPATAFTTALLANLDSFGKKRGDHAHNSASKAVVSLLDPESEYKRVTSLVNDLQVFDQWLVAYRRVVK